MVQEEEEEVGKRKECWVNGQEVVGGAQDKENEGLGGSLIGSGAYIGAEIGKTPRGAPGL